MLELKRNESLTSRFLESYFKMRFCATVLLSLWVSLYEINDMVKTIGKSMEDTFSNWKFLLVNLRIWWFKQGREKKKKKKTLQVWQARFVIKLFPAKTSLIELFCSAFWLMSNGKKSFFMNSETCGEMTLMFKAWLFSWLVRMIFRVWRNLNLTKTH